MACLHDQYECAKLLLENHASLATKYPNANSSPIHLAAYHSSIPCLRLLIENGADVNSVCMGCTPLYEAASADNLPGCKLLLAEGNVYKFNVLCCSAKKTSKQPGQKLLTSPSLRSDGVFTLAEKSGQ